MIRQRLRKFVGMHPVLAVNLLTLGWLVFIAAAHWALNWLAEAGHIDRQAFEWGVFAAAMVALAGVAASAMLVAMVLGRAGKAQTLVLGGMKYVPVLCISLVLAWFAVDFMQFKFQYPLLAYGSQEGDLVKTWGLAILPMMAAQAAGWGLGALVSHWKLRRGKWEITRPAKPMRIRLTWGARHAGLVTGFMGIMVFFVGALAVIFLGDYTMREDRAAASLACNLPVPALVMFVAGLAMTLWLRSLGRSSRSVLVGAAWMSVFVWLLFFGLVSLANRQMVCAVPRHSRIWAALVASLVAGGSTSGGWAVAEAIVRRRMRRGTWEVTPPFERVEESP